MADQSASQVHAADLAHLVLVLIGRLKAVEDQRIERRIFGVAKLGQLVLDTQAWMRGLLGKNVAKSDAVVERPDFKRQLAAGLIGEIDWAAL